MSGPSARATAVLALAAVAALLPAHAQAQTWSATLTVDKAALSFFGCDNGDANQDDCSDSNVLSDDDFVHGGITYTVAGLFWNSNVNELTLAFATQLGSSAKAKLGSLTLNVDSTALAISDATVPDASSRSLHWTHDLGWTDGQTVSLSLTGGSAETTPPSIEFADGTPTVGTPHAITITDSGSKVAKYAVLEVDGAALDATGCDDPTGDSFTPTAVSPAASPYTAMHTPVAAGKKLCVYAEDANGNSASALNPTAIAAASPAMPAGDIWSATLTVDENGDFFGCDDTDNAQDNCSSSIVLTDNNFDYGGTTYTVELVYWQSSTNQLHLAFNGLSGAAAKTALGSLKLNVDGDNLAVADASTITNPIYWTYDPDTDWTDGQTIELSLTPLADPNALPQDWPLIPAGLTGESFRLLFVTSSVPPDATGVTAASESGIAYYNGFVQERAKGNADLADFGSQFKALISTAAVDARDNTGTTGSGVPIYWVKGAKVADDYTDFYDGDWDSTDAKTRTGETPYGVGSGNGTIWTGSNAEGTKKMAADPGEPSAADGYAGATEVATGDLLAGGNPLNFSSLSNHSLNPLYALSPVLTVPGRATEPQEPEKPDPPKPQPTQPPPPQPPPTQPPPTQPPPTQPPPGGGEPANRAPETADALGDRTVRAGEELEIDLSDAFDDPDGDDLEYSAESSDESVATIEVDGDALTVRGLAPGTAEITVRATDPDGASARQTFAVAVTGPETAWYLPPASDPLRQGFVRVLNHSDAAGEATVTATDDAGRTHDPLTLALGPRAAAHFHTGDLENGNAAKGLAGSTGMGEGGWRLEIDSEDLDVEALAYVRTPDGFLTGMNAVAPRDADGALDVAIFNPASNVDQVSLLRLVNPGAEDAEATVTGVDDAGASPGEPVRLTLPAGTACTVDAAQLESGTGLACGLPQDGLGDGTGKWRLTVDSDARLAAMSLLSSPAGHLTNLSGKAEGYEDVGTFWHVDLFPAAADPLGRQGFVRVVNRSSVDGSATVSAYDDGDTRYETLRLTLPAGATRHFNSDDLELGNLAKGLTGSTGSGRGTWRLRLYSGLDIEANAYVRTPDGFLTAMQARAPAQGSAKRVAFFNPGGNAAQVSVLRLVNGSSSDRTVTVDGTDDLGLRPGTTVSVAVPATDAVELTAAELESGEHDAIESGALGDGTGKWRLRVRGLVTVTSLLSSPQGHLTNLSGADGARGLGELPAALLPAPETVTLESPARRELRGRWSAVAGARYAVDLLRDGVAEEDRSLSYARNTTTSFHWTHLRPGTYAIRACSVNEDRVRGPCRVSDAVVVD